MSVGHQIHIHLTPGFFMKFYKFQFHFIDKPSSDNMNRRLPLTTNTHGWGRGWWRWRWVRWGCCWTPDRWTPCASVVSQPSPGSTRSWPDARSAPRTSRPAARSPATTSPVEEVYLSRHHRMLFTYPMILFT